MDGHAAIAILAAAIGGLATQCWKLIHDRRRSRKSDAATVTVAEIADRAALTDDMWREIHDLRDRVDAITDELDRSRLAHAELLGKYSVLKAEHNQLKREHDHLQSKHDLLQAELEQLRTETGDRR
jgi:chromosome segregation ATPase